MTRLLFLLLLGTLLVACGDENSSKGSLGSADDDATGGNSGGGSVAMDSVPARTVALVAMNKTPVLKSPQGGDTLAVFNYGDTVSLLIPSPAALETDPARALNGHYHKVTVGEKPGYISAARSHVLEIRTLSDLYGSVAPVQKELKPVKKFSQVGFLQLAPGQVFVDETAAGVPYFKGIKYKAPGAAVISGKPVEAGRLKFFTTLNAPLALGDYSALPQGKTLAAFLDHPVQDPFSLLKAHSIIPGDTIWFLSEDQWYVWDKGVTPSYQNLFVVSRAPAFEGKAADFHLVFAPRPGLNIVWPLPIETVPFMQVRFAAVETLEKNVKLTLWVHDATSPRITPAQFYEVVFDPESYSGSLSRVKILEKKTPAGA